MLQPAADIYLNRLIQNYHVIREIAGNANIMAVIKANAYGHGAVPVARVLSDEGVHGFCVALGSEAEELINAGIQEPILHLGRISNSNLELYKSGQVRCTINTIEDVKELAKFGTPNSPVFAHLKIDTGMGRMGVRLEEAESIMKSLIDIPEIRVEGVYSHFATAEENDTQYRDWQLDQFQIVVKMAKEILPDVKHFHIANSAGILNYPDSHFNMVRPGISLYGVSPLGKPHDKLKPVMKMKAKVILVKKMKAGESVGYNRLYTAKQDENIALLQAGYADGIPIVFSNSGSVDIKGAQFPIAGNVSMDLVAVRCEDRNINDGDEAVFWGGDHENTRLEYLAIKYGKIPYEFLTGVSARVARNLINE
mgnify:FL=1